jgi:alpha/beta superfamily hydrolase
MPLNYQLYEDYTNHAAQFEIKKAIGQLQIPILICHGTNDTAVPIEKAYALQQWQPAASLFTVESDHVFDRKHPWLSNDLPTAMQNVLDATIQFLKQ